MTAPGAALLRESADRKDVAEIFSAVGVDNHRRLNGWGSLLSPREELFSISLEGDFYEMRHFPSSLPPNPPRLPLGGKGIPLLVQQEPAGSAPWTRLTAQFLRGKYRLFLGEDAHPEV